MVEGPPLAKSRKNGSSNQQSATESLHDDSRNMNFYLKNYARTARAAPSIPADVPDVPTTSPPQKRKSDDDPFDALFGPALKRRAPAKTDLLNAIQKNVVATGAPTGGLDHLATAMGGGPPVFQKLEPFSAACEKYIQRFIDDETGASGVEEGYEAKNDKVFMWQVGFSRVWGSVCYAPVLVCKLFVRLASS